MSKKEELKLSINTALFSAYITGKDGGERTFNAWEKENRVTELIMKDIEQEIKQARIDELKELAEGFVDDLNNATIFEDASRHYGLEYARISTQNRINQLKEKL